MTKKIGLFLIFFLLASHAAFADFDRAKSLYEKALQETDPAQKIELLQGSIREYKSFNAYYELGKAYLKTQQMSAAEQAFRDAAAIASTPKAEAKALAKLGFVYAVTGREQEAVICLKSSYQKHPYPKVLENLEQLEAAIVEKGMTSSDIKRALRSSKAFGVEPVVDLRVQFKYNRAEIEGKGIRQVEELGKALSDTSFSQKTFALVGHTDSRGSDEYNQRLSKNRAAAVKQHLVQYYGISASRITTEGRGERELLYPGNTERQHALNRRVELRMQ